MMINSGVYYGLSLNTSNLGGNDYHNFMISGAVEIPGLLLAVYTVDNVGRRLPLCAFMVAGGTALLTGIFLSKESFPTVVRNVAVGSSSTVARVGGALAPYINLLGEFWLPLPFIIFGGLSCTSGLLCLLLQEMKNQPMTDLIEEKVKQPISLSSHEQGPSFAELPLK